MSRCSDLNAYVCWLVIMILKWPQRAQHCLRLFSKLFLIHVPVIFQNKSCRISASNGCNQHYVQLWGRDIDPEGTVIIKTAQGHTNDTNWLLTAYQYEKFTSGQLFLRLLSVQTSRSLLSEINKINCISVTWLCCSQSRRLSCSNFPVAQYNW